jgi:hypothetical protein
VSVLCVGLERQTAVVSKRRKRFPSIQERLEQKCKTFSSFWSVLRTELFTAFTYALFYILFSHKFESVMDNYIKVDIGEKSFEHMN